MHQTSNPSWLYLRKAWYVCSCSGCFSENQGQSYCLSLNFISSQCVHGKSLIAREPEVHLIFFLIVRNFFKNVSLQMSNFILVSFGLVSFLFYGPSTHFRSFRARSVNLATLFLGKPPRQFTST